MAGTWIRAIPDRVKGMPEWVTGARSTMLDILPPEAGFPRSDGLVPATLEVAGVLKGGPRVIVIAFSSPSVRSSD
jgi:hypothetical protein